MKAILAILLPQEAGRRLRGSQLPLVVLALVATVGVVRSLIHILAPDGGAGSIAGLDLNVSGASGIILAFALWGSAQLIYALLQWLVVLRYRALVPMMWLVQLAETLLRMLVGQLKPASFAHTPPGAWQNSIYLPLAAAMLGLSLWSASRQKASEQP